MKIFAIDPGPTESAFVVLENGKVSSFGKVCNESLLEGLLMRPNEEEILVIEQIASYGMAVGVEVFETCFWSGRFAQAWSGKFDRLKRHEIKMHLCHTARAKDGNIRQALIDKLGPPGTKKSKGVTYGISGDVWSALAVAVTYAETRK